MITLYGAPKTRSLRIVWMMEEIEQPYDYCSINLMIGEGRKPEFQAINPAGKVPVMKDGDLILTESAAIITYLGDKFKQSSLVPTAGSALRGKYDQWCYFGLPELEQPLWTMAKHQFALPEKYRAEDIIKTSEWEYQRALTVLSQGLADKEYILGSTFSAADIILFQILQWGKANQQSVEQANLLHYINRIKQRPALQRAQQREKPSIE